MPRVPLRERSYGLTVLEIFLFYITATNQLASKQFISGSWTSRDNFSPTGTPNMTITTATNTRALSCTLLNNNVLSGQAFVFYVAQNGSVESLTITPTSADSIVASPGPSLPSNLQGGHVLALAAGTSEANNVATPQVGVLTSNGSVYYDLYFSFFNNSGWTPPERTCTLFTSEYQIFSSVLRQKLQFKPSSFPPFHQTNKSPIPPPSPSQTPTPPPPLHSRPHPPTPLPTHPSSQPPTMNLSSATSTSPKSSSTIPPLAPTLSSASGSTAPTSRPTRPKTLA